MQRPQNYGGVPKQLMGLCRKKFKENFVITTNLLFPMTKNHKKNNKKKVEFADQFDSSMVKR